MKVMKEKETEIGTGLEKNEISKFQLGILFPVTKAKFSVVIRIPLVNSFFVACRGYVT